MISQMGWFMDPGKSQGPASVYRWLGVQKDLRNAMVQDDPVVVTTIVPTPAGWK